MSKQRLHRLQINAVLKVPSCERSAEFMRVGVLHIGFVGNLNAIIPTMRVLVAVAVSEHEFATPGKFLEDLQEFIRHFDVTSFPRLRLPVLLRRHANNTSDEVHIVPQ